MYSKKFIEQYKYGIHTIKKDGEMYIVDYLNLPNECEENELNFVVVNVTERYLVDNQNKYERLYLSDLADKENVVLYKLEPIEK